MTGKSPAEISRLTGVPVRTVLKILEMAGPVAPLDFTDKTKSELRQLLAEVGLEAPSKATKADLVELMQSR